MNRPRRFTLETCFVCVLLIGGIAIGAISWNYGFGTLARPGPGLYPFFVGAAIAGLSALTLLAQLRTGAAEPALDRHSALTLGLMSLTFCLWIVAMPLLGYVLVTLLATFAFCKIMRLQGWWMPLLVSGGTALFIYLLFDYWLYIDLPRGLLG